MSPQNSVSDALTAAALTVNQYIQQTELEALLDKEEKIRSELEKESDRFFAYIRDYVMLTMSGVTPAMFRGYTTWRPLTKQWMRHKAKHSKRVRRGKITIGGVESTGSSNADKHYRGLTGKLNVYIKQLATSGNSNRLFGTPITRLAFGDGSESTVTVDKKVVTKQGRVVLMGYRPDGKYGFITPKAGRPSITVKAFPNLQNLPSTEEALTDWLAVKTGRREEWMKVYSTHNQRPIRPIILPMLKWYVEKGFPRAMAKVISK